MNPFRKALKKAEELLNSQSSQSASDVLPSGKLKPPSTDKQSASQKQFERTEESLAETKRPLKSTVTDVTVSYKTVDLTEPRSAWRSLWLAEMARRGSKATTPLLNPMSDIDGMRNRSQQLVSAMFDLLTSLAEEFNAVGNFPRCALRAPPPPTFANRIRKKQ